MEPLIKHGDNFKSRKYFAAFTSFSSQSVGLIGELSSSDFCVLRILKNRRDEK